ncbi:MAG: 3-methylitaconate isomerase [Alphaproteobacteria bacterium]|nr:3-methylitaconate isomerase [Alphaproteobacteria bacterium]
MGVPVRCVIMRGGTSKAVFLKESDLPVDEAARDRLILRIFGSPDKRQIDGLGGADPLTSKLAIIGPTRSTEPRAAGSHLTYTFGQVGIDTDDIDYLSLCGNITSAVGAFAVHENMVEPVEPVTTVKIYNTNLQRILTVEVPVAGRRPREAGDYAVPGVPGTGAPILVDFAATAGGATGSLLPTGNPVDRLDVPGVGTIEASLVDIGNAHVFVRARDVGIAGTESAAEIDARADLRERLERIRAAAARRVGMLADIARSRQDTPATPLLAMIGPPADYRDDVAGTLVRADQCDVVSRLMFMQQTHKTYAGTSTVATGVASRVEGSVVHEVARRPSPDPERCRIGHPAGVIATEVRVAPDGNGWRVERATLGRTARRILEGTAFVPDAVFRSAAE